ncbi:MAG TPA: hypothetical protein VGO98_00030 [Candidatus Saccharimonadales bacterium]|jgi:uncharacterized coiled-coil DUF342 family protein|nr:hypothetical protein [Candidatus Saccharimonadales bacterium]
MSEQLPQNEQMQAREDVYHVTAPVDVELSLNDWHEEVSALCDSIDVPRLIDTLTQLQEWRDGLPQLQNHIGAVEDGINLLDAAFEEIDEGPRKISEAIDVAKSRIEDATAELKSIRDQTAVIEDAIDELGDRDDDETSHFRKSYRAKLSELDAQKNTQRTIKQLQSRAIEELEARLITVRADVEIEKNVHAGIRTQYQEREAMLDNRLQYLSTELGKVANAVTVILTTTERVIDLPQLDDLPSLPGRLQDCTPIGVVDARPAYRLSDTPTDVWMDAAESIQSIPVHFEMPKVAAAPKQLIDEPPAGDDQLPYEHIRRIFSSSQRPRVTSKIIKAVEK